MQLTEREQWASWAWQEGAAVLLLVEAVWAILACLVEATVAVDQRRKTRAREEEASALAV